MQIQLPQDYPYSPPDFIMLTPNGRFRVGAKICTSFSSFHPETWSPAYTLTTLLLSFISFFTDEDSPAQGMVRMSVAQRKDLALGSVAWGAKSVHKSTLKIFQHLKPGLQTQTTLAAAAAKLKGVHAAPRVHDDRGGKCARRDSAEQSTAPAPSGAPLRLAATVDLAASTPASGNMSVDGAAAGGTIDLTAGQLPGQHGVPGAIKRARAAARAQAAALAGAGRAGTTAPVANATADVVDLT